MTELAKKSTGLTIRDRLQSPSFLAELAKVVPKHMPPERMARVLLSAYLKTPKLQLCDDASLLQAMMSCSQLGLEPDGRLAHLVPYGKTCQLIVDYKGLVELAYRSGMVRSIHADVIRQGDVFEFNLGQVVKHTPWAWRSDKAAHKQGEIIGAYCLVRMDGGIEKHEVMDRGEIDAIRKRSQSGSTGPWVTDYAEMAKKTVFRRASKWLPLSAEMREAFDSDDDRIVDARPSAISVTDLENVFEVAQPVMEGEQR